MHFLYVNGQKYRHIKNTKIKNYIKTKNYKKKKKRIRGGRRSTPLGHTHGRHGSSASNPRPHRDFFKIIISFFNSFLEFNLKNFLEKTFVILLFCLFLYFSMFSFFNFPFFF